MAFINDIKNNRDTQIYVVAITFFLIAFPAYFAMASSLKEMGELPTASGDWTVTAEWSYITLAEGTQDVENDQPYTAQMNTDSVSEAKGKNVVGVMVTLTYGEDETANGITCGAANGNAAPDDITGMINHGEYSDNATGQNPGEHMIMAIWYNDLYIGENVSNISKSTIEESLDAGDKGMGEYNFEISVNANAGNAPGACTRSDDGETVSYLVQLMVLDYTIEAYEGTESESE